MRVLILAPVGRDSALLAQTLGSESIDTALAPDAEALLPMLAEGVGTAIVADEAISTAHLHRITQWLSTQPPWSDPPFLVLTPSGRPTDHSIHRAREFSSLGNFTLIERPVRPETILSSVRAALRGRMKQYEVRSRQESLLQANADLEQFAHSASHDLKEPLRDIRISADLLLREYAPTLDQRGLVFLNSVRESSKRMDRLLADLLAYSEASHADDRLPEPIPAKKPLEAAIANLGVSIREADARIAIGELPQVQMGASHLTQLFQNLIANAIKYRRDDVAPQVCISCQALSDRTVFSIADNGIGIAPEYRESIFGIFKRLHSNSKYSGSGIGLAICQRIVEKYGGRIWVESEPGIGSTFFFTIPS